MSHVTCLVVFLVRSPADLHQSLHGLDPLFALARPSCPFAFFYLFLFLLLLLAFPRDSCSLASLFSSSSSRIRKVPDLCVCFAEETDGENSFKGLFLWVL